MFRCVTFKLVVLCHFIRCYFVILSMYYLCTVYLNIKVCVILVKFCPSADIYVIIWTTTPWTLPLNQAICFASNIQ